ncbi:MAG: AMP-binding protein [Parachlamydiales bacterium]|jgi:long-chain-fatty-acid--[acyl-carrier-protein] ligase
MTRWIVGFLCQIIWLFFRFRYRIKVVGKKKLKSRFFNRRAGVLFLPNHPALIEPVFLFTLLWPRFRLRPLVVEYIYRQKSFRFFMRLAKAISVPDLDTSMNEVKIIKTEKAIKEIAHGLKHKENYLLYPSGRLKGSGKEVLGGSSAAHKLIQEVEGVNLVLVRVSGLWGSSFSRAYTPGSPDFKKVLFARLKNLAASALFFLPKRRVLIELEMAGEDFPRQGSRLEINRYLENWYNQYPDGEKRVETEPLRRLSYSCFKEKLLKPFLPEKKNDELPAAYSFEAEAAVLTELKRMQPDLPRIDPGMSLASDLGLDSLDIAELITFLNVRFHIKEAHPEEMLTVKDLIAIASGGKRKKKSKTASSSHSWPLETICKLREPEGKTLFEAVLKTADRLKGQSALGDDLVGVLSYSQMKRAALALALEFKKLPGKYIGILLPASVGADLAILASMLSGKVPVMMNWTVGSRFLNHMVELTKVKAVISSWRFLERLSGVEFGSVAEKLVLLEDIKDAMGLATKLKAAFLAQLKTPALVQRLNLETISEKDEAVVLFTSGTEANPKGVPLSHKNILFDLKSAFSCVEFSDREIMLGVLPPFHSFGFTVAGLFPLLCGMRVAYSPDPTDSYAIAEAISRWKATLFCSAPSFLKGLFSAASEQQLKTMRLFVSGAEKTPQEFFTKVKMMGKELIEGYGITECSPVLAIRRPGEASLGVGRLLPGVEMITVHPETKEVLPFHTEGEICVFGDNIFNGYLGEKKDPFLVYEGKRWYCTGDLGYMDKEGYLILSGRLKRFIKIGGEMVSLGAIEETLLKYLEGKKLSFEGAPLALVASEKEGGKGALVLFTVLDLDKNELNLFLKQAGFGQIVKISQVCKLEQIPLMGTGKTDYRFLQQMV